MRVLALDPGTTTGWAVRRNEHTFHGSIDFTRYAPERALLFERFDRWLADRVTEHKPTMVAFETPIHRGAGSRVGFGFAGIVELTAARRGLFVADVNISTIKKHLTGSGAATKAQMIEAARERGWKPADDHQADALALLDYVVANAERQAA